MLKPYSLSLVLSRNHCTFCLELPLKFFAKTEVKLSFGLNPYFRSELRFGPKL